MKGSKDLRVTIVQAKLAWEDIDVNLDSFKRKLSSIHAGETDLIVLPEMFSTGFTMNAKKVAETMKGSPSHKATAERSTAVKWMAAIAKEKKSAVMGSLVIKEKGHYFNRLVWMKEDGNYELYDKRHLFRMGEEQNTYTPGKKRLIVSLKGWRICPLICYDLRFPVWSRNTASNLHSKEGFQIPPSGGGGAYDCLIYVANWPARRNYAWKHLLVARAIENLSYVVGVNRIGTDGNGIGHTGDSAVINAKGEVISKTAAETESVETVTLSRSELDNYRKEFPALLDADRFKY